MGLLSKSVQPQSVLAQSEPPSARARIAHLYRRAGFGARPEELDAAVAAGYRATVERLLNVTAPDPGVAKLRAPATDDGLEIVLWWMKRMIAATNPLPEKLTLFWHGHFATSLQKVRSPALMARQNQLLRTMGAGRFEPLVQAVAKDPAMMVWLDANSNKRESPNENFARELFELFTLGEGRYSERDIKAAARAFTGWRVDRMGQFTIAPRLHDDGPKVLFGQTGNFGGEDVIRLATARPDCARFIAAKVWSHFARPTGTDDPIVTQLANVFAPDLDIRALLRAVFLHPEFQSPATRAGLVKQPIEYVAGALRALGRPAKGADLLHTMRLLGQEPFRPPSVGGWPANGFWLSTASSLGRLRFADTLTRHVDLSPIASVAPTDRPAAAARMLSLDSWGPATTQALREVAEDPRALLTLALVAPEYVLA